MPLTKKKKKKKLCSIDFYLCLVVTAALRGADGKRVVALLASHPMLVRFIDATGKNILHVGTLYLLVDKQKLFLCYSF